MGHKWINIISRFFLRLHYVVMIYLFVSAPTVYVFPGVLLVFCLSVLFLLVPLGPLPIGLLLFILAWPLYFAVNGSRLAVPFIMVFTVVKLIIHRVLGDSEILVVKASRLQAWVSWLFVAGSASLFVTALLTGPGTSPGEALSCFYSYAYWSTALSLPIDLVLLSYTKYRDAALGNASPHWLLALPILWSSILWLSTTFFQGSILWLLEKSSIPYTGLKTILIALWILIPPAQIVLHIKIHDHYKNENIKKNTQPSGCPCPLA